MEDGETAEIFRYNLTPLIEYALTNSEKLDAVLVQIVPTTDGTQRYAVTPLLQQDEFEEEDELKTAEIEEVDNG
jgi:hypothetical protein